MIDIRWLGHSSFELTLPGGEVILLDPWLEGTPKYPAGHVVKRCDAILLSHAHGDHFGSVADLVKKFSPQVVCIYELHLYLESKGLAGSIGMNKGGTLDLGFAQVTMTNAFHSSSVFEDGRIIYAGDPAGFVIEAGGRRIYFAGDTCVFGDMRLIAEIHGPLDVAMLPIGDLYTMGPKEASHACRLLRPKQVIPMHWGTFPPLTGTPQALAALIADVHGTSVAALEPGASLQV
jgi:L-ascorbate metabolism protein UlaG (beta-lactamase superfamily)